MSFMESIFCESPIRYSHKKLNSTRLKEGLRKYKQALDQDEKKAAARGSGLPKDWRSRVFK